MVFSDWCPFSHLYSVTIVFIFLYFFVSRELYSIDVLLLPFEEMYIFNNTLPCFLVQNILHLSMIFLYSLFQSVRKSSMRKKTICLTSKITTINKTIRGYGNLRPPPKHTKAENQSIVVKIILTLNNDHFSFKYILPLKHMFELKYSYFLFQRYFPSELLIKLWNKWKLKWIQLRFMYSVVY